MTKLKYHSMINIKSIQKFIFLLGVVTFHTSIVAQKKFSIVDSLNKIELASTDNVKIETYMHIGRAYLIEAADNWLQGAHNPDDITFIVIKKN